MEGPIENLTQNQAVAPSQFQRGPTHENCYFTRTIFSERDRASYSEIESASLIKKVKK